jgi:hypothetical protein
MSYLRGYIAMLQTRHCARADCGREFTEEGFHTMCPRCRKMIQREKERTKKRELLVNGFYEDGTQVRVDWWLPQ